MSTERQRHRQVELLTRKHRALFHLLCRVSPAVLNVKLSKLSKSNVIAISPWKNTLKKLKIQYFTGGQSLVIYYQCGHDSTEQCKGTHSKLSTGEGPEKRRVLGRC